MINVVFVNLVTILNISTSDGNTRVDHSNLREGVRRLKMAMSDEHRKVKSFLVKMLLVPLIKNALSLAFIRSREIIVVEPYNGLSNRMRSINSGLALSKKANKPLVIIWRNDDYFNCPFNKLLTLPGQVKVIDCQYGLMSFIQRFRALLYRVYSDRVIIETSATDRAGEDYLSIALRHRSVYIGTGYKFYEYPNFNDLKPIKDIQKDVEEVANKFGDNTIGVHIRRGDHGPASLYSKTDYFIAMMKDEINKNKNVRFFVASDSAEEKERLRQLFGERVITYSVKSFDRNSINGNQAALVELLSLSKTKKILGSYYSSFSSVASEINDIKRVVVVKGR